MVTTNSEKLMREVKQLYCISLVLFSSTIEKYKNMDCFQDFFRYYGLFTKNKKAQKILITKIKNMLPYRK